VKKLGIGWQEGN